jgi:CDP-glycerol glycerophosphotransferase (TagB/SpsB family)
LQQCADYFEEKGYEYILTFNEKKQEYFDANLLRPDIVFYTNPYKGLIDDRYYIDKFPNSLTCYINYAYNNVRFEYSFNLPFHQQLWRYFVECKSNFSLVKSYSPINGKNCTVVGYPMYDAFVQGTDVGYDWKIQDKKRKRIIWSPHHTISIQSQTIRFSTFELYYDVMWKFAEKYKDQIQIAFKPHPLLKEALYRLDGWGKERTDKYYDMWRDGKNTAFVVGEYIDLFNSSDAIINDSGSFTIEYLYMRKPCLFLNNYDRQADANEVASKAFDCWYHATDAVQIERFIIDVVLNGNDSLQTKREDFYNKMLLPPCGCSVAENVVNEIKRSIW